MKSSYKVGSVKQFIDVSGLDEKDEILRKQYAGDIKIMPDEERTVVARISSVNVDAEGDMIDPAGCDFTRFMKNALIHKNHDYKVESVIGKAKEIAVDSEGIVAKIQFADTPTALDCWKLVSGGYVKAHSIGFISREVVVKGTQAFTDYIKEKGWKVTDACRRIIKRFELIESSLVSVPCNPDALNMAISAKSIELSEKTIKELDLPKIEIKTEVEAVIEEILKNEKEVVEIEIKVCACPNCLNKEECDCEGVECTNEECDCNCHVVEEEALKAKQVEEETAAIINSPEVDEKPFPNEHAARQNNPSKYESFRRVNDAFGAGIAAIYGIYMKDGKRTTEVQSLRFSKDKFTVSEAKKWLTDHNYNNEVEPAEESKVWKVIRNGGYVIEQKTIIEKKSGKIV